MTERKRTQILTACAFAKVFLELADAELQGAPSEPRMEAANELEAALMNLASRRDSHDQR